MIFIACIQARAREYYAALYPDGGKTPKGKPDARSKGKKAEGDDTPQPIRPIRKFMIDSTHCMHHHETHHHTMQNMRRNSDFCMLSL
eukprot:1160256-Pelagomonas_calceolata.AAC.3